MHCSEAPMGMLARCRLNLPLGQAVRSTGELADQRPADGVSGAVNTAFAAYGATVDWITFLAAPVQAGVWAFGHYQRKREAADVKTPRVSTVSGGDLLQDAGKTGSILDEGTQVNVKSMDMRAGTYSAQVAAAEVAASFQAQSADGQVGVSSSIGVGGSSQSSVQRHKIYVRRMIDDEAKLDIAGDAILSGFVLDADQVRINALNLVLESLQDEMSASGGQGSVRIDPFSMGKLSSLLTSVGGGMERQMSRWVQEVSRLTGRQGVNIVVGQTLKMVGSMIANAERDPTTGQLTDKGRLQVQAGDILVEDIANFDRGLTLSIMASNLAAKLTDGMIGRSYRGTFGFHIKDGTTRATGSLGDWIIAGVKKTPAELGLNTNLDAVMEVDTDISLAPIHWRYTSVNWAAVRNANLIDPAKFGERVAKGIEQGLDEIKRLAKIFSSTSQADKALPEFKVDPKSRLSVRSQEALHKTLLALAGNKTFMELLETVEPGEQAQVVESLLKAAVVLSQKYGLSAKEVEGSIHWAVGEIAKGYHLAELAIKDPAAAKEQGVDTLAFAPIAVAAAAAAPEVVVAVLITITTAVATSLVMQEQQRQNQARAQHGMDAAPESAGWTDDGVNTEDGKVSVLWTPAQTMQRLLESFDPSINVDTGTLEGMGIAEGVDTSILTKNIMDERLKGYVTLELAEKIYGRAQSTKTTGHDTGSLNIASEAMKSGNYKEVYLNRAYRTATGELTIPRRLPDVIGIRHDGTVDVWEVRSRTDNTKDLFKRNDIAMSQLPKGIQGTIRIMNPEQANAFRWPKTGE